MRSLDIFSTKKILWINLNLMDYYTPHIAQIQTFFSLLIVFELQINPLMCNFMT
jgi:hypothetical protein